jgi:hypothetical protein
MDTTAFYSPVITRERRTSSGEEKKSSDFSSEPVIGTTLITTLPAAVKVRDTSKELPTLRPSSFGDSEFQVG